MLVLFRLFSHFPLFFLHGLGAVLGWITYLASPRYRTQLNTLIAQAGYDKTHKFSAIAHAGRMFAELPRVWLGRPVHVQWKGLEHIEAARAKGQPMIFMSGHLGGYEVAAQSLGALFGEKGQTLLVLYRPARKAWIEPLVGQSRAKSSLQTVPTTLSGVRTLLRAMKNGQSLAIASDQVPPEGMGEWAPFFGRSAYTMTLASKLVKQTGAQLILTRCVRLPWSRGYEMVLEPWNETFSDDPALACAQMNQALESIIRACPEQYLWGYARYKQPRPQ